MFNPRSNSPYGRNMFGSSGYQYQTQPYAEGTQATGLISKVMLLLTFSFLFASIGSFVGFSLLPSIGVGTLWLGAIGGLVVLLILRFTIQVSGLNLVLLYLFTFLEGLSLSPLLSAYLQGGYGNILGEAFLITAVTSLGLAAYAWTTKRDFSRLGDYLFFGLILLIVAGIVGIFFHSTFFAFIISIVGIAIFSGYVLYYVQRAKYLADTMPNAIGLTASIFITVLNLFLYILQLLSILQGGRNRN
jgi:modulator of FtsH protease